MLDMMSLRSAHKVQFFFFIPRLTTNSEQNFEFKLAGNVFWSNLNQYVSLMIFMIEQREGNKDEVCQTINNCTNVESIIIRMQSWIKLSQFPTQI